MISPNKLIKFGEKNQVMEFKDKLQVNDFYNELGVLQTTVHGKFSRIEFNIVDARNKQEKATQIGEFSFNPKEICTLLSRINSNGDVFKENVRNYNRENKVNSDCFSILKIHHFRKDNQGKSPVRTFKLSYESGMKNSYKWEFTIETGNAIPACSEHQNGGKLYFVKSGTYTEESKVTFYLYYMEVREMEEIILQHIAQWTSYSYPKMLNNREKFYKRAKENNYKEESINEWNSKSNNFTNNTHNIVSESVHRCERCKKETDIKVLEYSKMVTGKSLCLDCKNKEEK